MNGKRLVAAFTVLLLYLLSSMEVSGRGYTFQRLPSGNNMPNQIKSMVEDNFGNMWIGSQQEGLVRYNGSSVAHYISDSTDAFSLPSNIIYEVLKDLNGDIWAITIAGTARYSREKDHFEPLRLSDENGVESNVFIRSGRPTKDGVLFGGKGALYFYSYADKSLKRLLSVEKDGEPYIIHGIFDWTGGQFLLWSIEKGLYVYDLASNSLLAPPVDFQGNFKLFVDSHFNIWRSVYNGGLICYSPAGEEIVRFNTSNSKLSSDIVLCMAESADKHFFGTDGGGINVFDNDTREVSVLCESDEDYYSFPGKSVNCLYYNNNTGICWAGLVRGGVVVVNESYIKTYKTLPSYIQNGLGNSAVLWFYDDLPNNCTWIGTDGSGLKCLSRADGSIVGVPSTEGLKVMAIAKLPFNKLLLSCYGKGLRVYDISARTLSGPINLFSEEDLKSFTKESGCYICNDGAGHIFGFTDAIFEIDENLKGYRRIDMPKTDNLNSLMPVIGSSPYDIWVHDNYHIFRYNVPSGNVTLEFQMPHHNYIKSACVAPDGRVWMATTMGVGRLDNKDKSFKPLNTQLFYLPLSIIPDAFGRLWIGSSEGLCVYMPDSESFIRMDECDGAAVKNYLPYPKMITDKGEIFLGGNDGFIRIDPSISFFSAKNETPVLESIVVDDNRYLTSRRIKVSHDNKVIVINVVVAGDNPLRTKRFRYKTEGPKNNYELQSDKSSLTLHHLLPGYHKVYASYTFKNGQWSDWTEVVSIKVRWPWYLRLWAIAIWVVIMAVGAQHYYLWRKKFNRMKINGAMDRERIQFLMNVNHEIRTPLTLVSAPIEKMVKTLDPEDPNYRRFKNASNQLRRVRTLLNTVLMAHKLEDGVTGVDMKPCDLNATMTSVAEEFRDESENRGIILDIKTDPSIGTVVCDEEKVSIVLRNILINALKHTPDNTGILVETLADRFNNVARVSVTDDGAGLEGIDPQQLFTRFYQGLAEKTGTGIGMSYCKIILDKHHGRIGARNSENRGATFFFELPLKA